nr:MAG TPA: hypothetical protein [Caudoviricetes sp.]
MERAPYNGICKNFEIKCFVLLSSMNEEIYIIQKMRIILLSF